MEQYVKLSSGALGEVESILEDIGARRVFLVTGRNSYESSGAKGVLDEVLKPYTHNQFSDFSPNPKLVDAIRGVDEFNKGTYDCFLAVGGGSVIDMAKLIRVFSSHTANPRDIVGKQASIENSSIPLIAVPTTAGSGSEATHFAVVYMDRKKYSVAHSNVLPEYALVDPNLSMSLPARITACSGLDALCQGIESLWSKNSTEESKKYSVKAISLALKGLVNAVNHPSLESRTIMSNSAYLAGKAINISKTTACHALSYAITASHGVPHGLAVALTMPSMIEYNAQEGKSLNDVRGQEYLSGVMDQLYHLFSCHSASSTANAFRSLLDSIHVAHRLRDVGITKGDLPVISEQFNLERGKNNPIELTRDDIDAVLEDSL